MQPREMTFEEMLQEEQDKIPTNVSGNLTQGIPGLDAMSVDSMSDSLPKPDIEQPSMRLDTVPLGMPNFANKQVGTGVDFVNNLFKDTPAFDPRVQPMSPDQFNMDEMTIESDVPKAQKLKNMLAKSQALRKPASQPQPETPQEIPPVPSQQGGGFDNLLLGQGMSKVLQGIARTQGGQIDDNADFYNKYRQYQMDKPLRELELKSKQKAFDDSVKMSDPNSQESRNFRKALESLPYGQELVKQYGKDWEGISAANKDTIFNVIKTKQDIEAGRERAQIYAQSRQDAKEDRNLRQEEARSFKREENLNKDIQKFQDKTQDTRNILDALNDFETVSGIPLDNTNVDKNGNLIVAGKKKDLPGVSIPGIGRTSFYDSDARKLRDSAAKIFNVELKSRSGAAVTDNELSRLRQEFSDGKFNTEAELVDAIKRYKKSAKRILKEQEAGYKPEVIQTYKERFDANNVLDTSPEKPVDKPSAKSQNKPKTVTQNGHTYTWNEEKQEYE